MLQITLQSSSMEWCWEGVQYQGPGSSCVRGLHIAQKKHYTGKEGTAAAVLSMDSKKDAGYFLLLLYREHLNILHFILLTQLHCSWPGGSPVLRGSLRVSTGGNLQHHQHLWGPHTPMPSLLWATAICKMLQSTSVGPQTKCESTA